MSRLASPGSMRSTAIAALVMLVTGALLPSASVEFAAGASEDPLGVVEQSYDFGSMLVSDPSILLYYSADLRGSVHYPGAGEGNGPFPVVLFMHGRHATCSMLGEEAFGACPDYTPGFEPVNSYQGYDYLAEDLAARGFVVISADVNDVNDRDLLGDSGARARAQVILRTLDEFKALNGAPCACAIGTDLMGRQDFSNVGLMGHSRGGEGVTRAISLNAQQAQPYALKAVFALAPTDFGAWTAPSVAHATLLPYCDGDVYDLQGAHMYDDSRYLNEATPAAKHQFLVMGTNHNFYNTVWTDDDAGFRSQTGDDLYCGAATGENSFGSGRLTAAEQRATGLVLINGFFRYYLAGDATYADVLAGASAMPAEGCPGTAACNILHASYHAPAGSRLIVEDALNAATLTGNDLGGQSTFTGFTSIGTCDANDCPSQQNTASAHQLTLIWDTAATYATTFPAQDISGHDVLSFRIGVNHEDPRNGPSQDVRVVLRDAHGATASIVASAHSRALFTPPGDASAKVVLNTVSLPLSAFAGLDFAAIAGIDLAFDQSPSGSVQVTDLMFQALPE